MPAYDWSRVSDNVFHAFHNMWLGQIQIALNSGKLPRDYYALNEQRAGPYEPDILVLEQADPDDPDAPDDDDDFPSAAGGTATLKVPPQAPPRTRLHLVTDEPALYAAKRRTLVIRHNSDDRIVALLEIVSRGNKDRPAAVRRFADKTLAALSRGWHVGLVDLFAPGPHDPRGLGGVLCEDLGLTLPADAPPPAIASFKARARPGFCELFADFLPPVGSPDPLPDLPLFLTGDLHVAVPLETTCRAAFAGTPARWRSVLQPTDPTDPTHPTDPARTPSP